jgi:hypothetical protein
MQFSQDLNSLFLLSLDQERHKIFKNHKSKIFLVFPNVPFNAVVFEGLNVNRAEVSTNGAKFQFDSFGEASPTRLSLATASPPDIYRDRRRGELGIVYVNSKPILSMVREHFD